MSGIDPLDDLMVEVRAELESLDHPERALPSRLEGTPRVALEYIEQKIAEYRWFVLMKRGKAKDDEHRG